MFCPKCGTKNPEDGKFCRSCGTDLASVNAAISGDLPALLGELDLDASCGQKESLRRKDAHEVYGDGVKGVITGIGFLIVSLALLFTGVAGGKAWWWALLFPAFFGFAKGVSDIMKSQKMLQTRRAASVSSTQGSFGSVPANNVLPSPKTDFLPANVESRYKTGDLVPPSVTDGTTRHLEMNSEGETMTLPKK